GTATPEEILEDQLIENCLREDLRPIEQARAYQSLMQRLGLSQRALAEKLDISQGQIMQSLKLLELPEAIRESVDEGKVAPSIGYEIAKVADPAQQMELAERAARGEAGRGQTRERTGAEAMELQAGGRRSDHGHDPRPGGDGRGGRRAASEGAQASSQRNRPRAARCGLIDAPGRR